MDRHKRIAGSMRARLAQAARPIKIAAPLVLSITLGTQTVATDLAGDSADDGDKTRASVPLISPHINEASAQQFQSTRIPVTRDDIAFLQQHLNAIGYDAGTADGIFGAKTQEALMAGLADNPDGLAVLHPGVVHTLSQSGYYQRMDTLVTENRQAYLDALYHQRGNFSARHMQYHLKYFAGFYHGPVDGIAGQSTERAIHQLEAHVAPPRLSDFDDHNLERAEPANAEIRDALETGNIEWLRWHMDSNDPLRLARPVEPAYDMTSPYLDAGRAQRHNHHHAGDDYATPTGTALTANAPVRVIFGGESWGYGKVVILEHGAGTYTLYAHLNEVRAEPGAYLQPGEKFAGTGNSGKSTGPHLHYEVLLYDGQEPVEINPGKFEGRDLADRQLRRFAIADAQSHAQKHGFFADAAVSGAFNARALQEPSSYLDQDPSNAADLHGGFDPRTARAVVQMLADNRGWLASVNIDVLHKLAPTPAGDKLARIMHDSREIAARLKDALNTGAHRTAQKLLTASGDYNGAIDGIIGPGSKTALRDYIQANDSARELSRREHVTKSVKEPS